MAAHGDKMTMIRNDRCALPAMVLAEADDHRLLFRFQGKKWAWITGAMSAWLLAAAGFLWWQHGFAVSLVFFALLGFALAAASVYSAATVRGMEIDKQRGSVRYAEKSVAGNAVWEKPFSDFASISVHYPRAQSSGKAGARSLTIEIVSRDGGYFRIGTRASGATGEAAARELAGRVGDMMGLPVVASIGKS
jgi:hypothetical protein